MGILSERIKRSRLRRVAPHVRGDVLDIGCGPALLLAESGAAIASYTGIDHNAGRIAALQRQYPQHRFHCKDLDEDVLECGRKFDTVLLIAVIEHVYNQKHLLKQLVPLLTPEGRIIITTPTPFGNDVVHRIGAALGLFSKDAAHDHIVLYNRRRFEMISRDFGLSLVEYRRFQCGCNQIAVLRRAG